MLLRPTWAEINVPALAQNLKNISRKIGRQTKILAIVKADAYGHGALAVAKVCEKYRCYLGVALIEEAITLRKAGIKAPLLILGSIFPFNNFKYVLEYNLIPTIASLAGARSLSRIAAKHKQKIKFHLKVDTGMGRIGIRPLSAVATIRKIKALPFIEMEGIYTHLASAEDDEVYSRQQIEIFTRIIKELEQAKITVKYKHVSGSAAILKYRNYPLNMVRPGLMMYGLAPFKGAEKQIALYPVLSLKTKIVYLKRLSQGNSISYGRTFITKRNSFIGTLPIGYADGYVRSLSNRAMVLVQGKRVPVIGRVCMDMCMIDLTGMKGIDIGEEVVLVGKQGPETISVNEVAEWAKTISYEIICGISARVPRIYKYSS
ncbi:MAG: alanine racemase [bacterium]|nr:alanine racemase [bacterium]MDD5353898.1 alanine racemase [bacterium]MDD5756796.1 alanine racemase [bacterium]